MPFPVDEKFILKAEETLGVEFPVSYKERMKNENGALLIPQRVVSELQGQYSVFVVNSENKIESRSVKIGDKYGDYVIIKEGITENDKIVLEGLQ